MEREVGQLRTENLRLKRQAESSAKRLTAAEEQLGRLREMLRTHRLEGLLQVVKCSGGHADNARARAACRACSLGKANKSSPPRRKR